MDSHSVPADVLARALEVVGERWSFLVLRDMWVRGPRRFGQLQRNLGIARNVLTHRLATLVAAGVVDRTAYQPGRYEYSLTPAGRDLVPALLLLATWGDRHLTGPEGPPTLFQHKDHDHLADPVTVCRACGGELTARTLVLCPAPEGQEPAMPG